MTVPKKNSILIFDTNIFLTGIDFSLIPSKIYTTPQVIEEIEVIKYLSKNRTILNRILAAIETGKLIVKSPPDKYRFRVKEKSKITGDFLKLSETDVGVIALALDLKEFENYEVIVYTNDYSIENLCSHLKLSFKSIFKEGIKKKYLFTLYCPSCKKTYDMSYGEKNCDNCGSELKRKAIPSK